ncbi:hypothetical protein [Halomontanus rarus]|uniref:hypothetical protein n=1 Tax=Halomontanus rarus TaxID=3034020 RepID=UPI0023E79137|nr:hypothetical protein [Halovivax sp. TS33]
MSGRSGGDSDAPVDDRGEDASVGGDDPADSDALEIADILESLAVDPIEFDPPVETETDRTNESDAPVEAEVDVPAETGTADGTASEPGATEPDTAEDTASEPAGPTCPRCGTRLVATTATGPDTLYSSPCGCRLARGDLEFE